MEPQNDITKNKETAVGPIVGVIIIIAVIVLGGLYFWGQRNAKTQTPPLDQTQETTLNNMRKQEASVIINQSTSTDPSTIEADLNATDVNGLGGELNTYTK